MHIHIHTYTHTYMHPHIHIYTARYSGEKEPYGLDWGWGDVLGVEVDYQIGTVRFYVNNQDQGVAFYETFDGSPVYVGEEMVLIGCL